MESVLHMDGALGIDNLRRRMRMRSDTRMLAPAMFRSHRRRETKHGGRSTKSGEDQQNASAAPYAPIAAFRSYVYPHLP